MTLSPNRPPGSTVGRREDGDISLGRIHQRTTPGTVAGVLRTAILDGTLAPGSQLRETHIAADLGVSRAPLREALSILADEGLVVKIPYKGAFVAEVSAKGMAEIASLRKRLEPYAIELALPRLTGAGRIKIDPGAPGHGHRGADNNDLTRHHRRAHGFHRAFYELSEHSLLLDLWQQLGSPAADVLLGRSPVVPRSARRGRRPRAAAGDHRHRRPRRDHPRDRRARPRFDRRRRGRNRSSRRSQPSDA